MRPVILVFAKAPVAGRVKTRLSPYLTLEDAAKLHKAFVSDTLESLNDCADVELWSDTSHPDWPVPHRIQCSGNLGDRMLHALSSSFAAGRRRVMVVGSDSPTLPRAAVQALLEHPADVALGPSEDGGFWGISCGRIHEAMFAGVPWSASETLARTVAAAEACGLSTGLGPVWWDVDTPADVERLRREPELPRYTLAALAGIQPTCPH